MDSQSRAPQEQGQQDDANQFSRFTGRSGSMKMRKVHPSSDSQQSEKRDSRRLLSDAEKETLRFKMHMFLDEPSSSKPALATSLFILFLIFFSSTTFVIQTVFPPDTNNEIWFPIEATCVAAFTIEFLLRLVCNPPANMRGQDHKSDDDQANAKKLDRDERIDGKAPEPIAYNSPKGVLYGMGNFFGDFLNWIDLIAIVPFYIELIVPQTGGVSSTRIFRVVRLARVFRVFKLSRYSSRMQVVGQALVRSREVLVMLVFVLSIVTVVFSSLVYYAERGTWTKTSDDYADDFPTRSLPVWMRKIGARCGKYRDSDGKWYYQEAYRNETQCQVVHQGGSSASGCCPLNSWCLVSEGQCYEKSPFDSIVQSFYFTIVTVTTVGYGDMVPKTPWGKSVAVMCTLVGIIMLALPISIIGVNFTTLWAEKGMSHSSANVEDVATAKDGDDPEQKKRVARLYRNFGELMEAIRNSQDDLENLLRETRRKNMEWADLVEQNARKCAMLERLTSVVNDVMTMADDGVQTVVAQQIRNMRDAFADGALPTPNGVHSQVKWRQLSLARRLVGSVALQAQDRKKAAEQSQSSGAAQSIATAVSTAALAGK